jgi:hypothetical protein
MPDCHLHEFASLINARTSGACGVFQPLVKV